MTDLSDADRNGSVVHGFTLHVTTVAPIAR